MTDTLPIQYVKTIDAPIHVSKPQPTAEGFERWRRSNNWMDESGSGLYHHIGNFEVLPFNDLYNRYKESL